MSTEPHPGGDVAGLIRGRTVLVTGAGGSIGSELSLQIAELKPAALVLLDHSENPIFELDLALAHRFPGVPLAGVVADIRDEPRLRAVFAKHQPDVIFHAAAHKHVPLMEEQPAEAITNNVLGTRQVVELAGEFAIPHLVFLSSDKAARPTSVMGATKRVGEMLVQQAARKHKRHFVSVRFGNVIGTRGSVVPVFQRQIDAGGPVTVTHPEMRRYFMTGHEAVELVLRAAVLGRGGETFALEMGAPVRIVQLAESMIRQAGKEPGKDIEIRLTGTRPGEKLIEEPYFAPSEVLPTGAPGVLRSRPAPLPPRFATLVKELLRAAESSRPDAELRGLLRGLVGDYEPAA